MNVKFMLLNIFCRNISVAIFLQQMTNSKIITAELDKIIIQIWYRMLQKETCFKPEEFSS